MHKAARETRRIGVGIMGIADMLNQLGIGYDSEEGISILEKISRFIANTSYKYSALLSEEKGESPVFNYDNYARNPFFQESLDQETKDIIKEKGLRNIALLSIAPTGTISNTILGFTDGNKNYMGVSSGIEPIFALYYTRRSETLDKKKRNIFFKIFHSTIQAFIDKNSLQDKVKKAKNIDDLRKILPNYFFRTAHFIEPQKRVRI